MSFKPQASSLKPNPLFDVDWGRGDWGVGLARPKVEP
jgi:hypothetical protein